MGGKVFGIYSTMDKFTGRGTRSTDPGPAAGTDTADQAGTR